MHVRHVPLLAAMADVYRLPRDPQRRFPAYLALVGAHGTAERPPLVAMNPMAGPHLLPVVEAFLAAGYETAAQQWLDAAAVHSPLDGVTQHGFGVADDIAGGWTNAADVEMKRRFVVPPAATAGWLCTTLRVSQPHTPTLVAHEITATVVRRAWQQRNGAARTLREHIRQEHAVWRRSPSPPPSVTDHDSLHALFLPLMDETAYPLLVAAMLGDTAAASLGYAGIGAPVDAGIRYAIGYRDDD